MGAYYPTPIGYFRDRVNVKKVQRVENGRGGWTETENDIGTFWAFLEPMNAQNIVQYRQADMNVNTKFVMRMNTAIDNHCVFYARGLRYIVDSVLPDRKQRILTILAIGEKDNGGVSG
jgi:SPP1 family predicted phage head-tail adaptor